MRSGPLVPALLTAFVSAFGSTARAQGMPQGVPQDGFPSWQERTLWVFVNRDRADPQTAMKGCVEDGGCQDADCYMNPLLPLAYDVDLGHSARLQPTILAENNVTLMHPSPCLLNPDIAKTYPDECDGGTDCVCKTPVQCANPPGTQAQACACDEDTSDTSRFEDPFVRIALFAPGSVNEFYAENLAAGQPDPLSVEQGWLLEDCTCCAADTCGATECQGSDSDTNGHRYNLMSTVANSIGLGAVATPPGDCWGGAGTYYWGQDFALFYNVPVNKIVAGSHFPESGTALSFYANWFDPVGGGPSKATVVIGSRAHGMTLDRGSGGNATYLYAATLPAESCQAYTFAFTDSSGDAVVLPTSGSYLAGDSCTTDYTPAGGCATGAGEPGLGALIAAAALCRRRGTGTRGRKLTKWR